MTHKKPKKRKRYFVVTAQDGGHWIEVNNIDIGYNQACEDWENYHKEFVEDLCIEHCKELERIAKDLPSEEETRKLYLKNCTYDFEMRSVAKTISKRIGVVK